jgi:hypothetical protein
MTADMVAWIAVGSIEPSEGVGYLCVSTSKPMMGGANDPIRTWLLHPCCFAGGNHQGQSGPVEAVQRKSSP